MRPVISVIVPVCNRTKYIGEAIESVLAQTYRNYEIIVIDDGSSVDIESALNPYADKIRLLHQSNKGLAAARNNGIRYSNGKYLAFLDDDDLFEPRKLEIQVGILEDESSIGIVYSDSYEFNDQERSTCILNPAVGHGSPSEEFAKLFFIDPNVRVPTVLVRRECFGDVGFFDETLLQHEDGDMLLRIALNWKVRFSDYPSARIRHHPNQMSLDRTTMNRSLLISAEKIMVQHPEFRKYTGPIADKRITEIKKRLIESLIITKSFNEASNLFSNLTSDLNISIRLSLMIRSAVPVLLERTILSILGYFAKKLKEVKYS